MVAGTDTLIIGGGIVGLSLAWELSGLGHTVTLLESNQCGRAASWAGVGILPPIAEQNVDDPLEQLRALSHRLLREWSQQLQAETGQDTGYHQCGGIYLATTAGEAATLAANRAYWNELGIEVQVFGSDQLAKDQPALSTLSTSGRLRAAVYLPGECQLRTPRYVQALQAACRNRGVRIEEHTEVVEFVTGNHGLEHIVARSGDRSITFRADRYCLTAGPWTALLLNRLGVSSGILPIRGQVLLFRTQPRLLHRIVNEGHRYLVPRDDGRILVGSNEEEVGFECQTTDEVLQELKNWAYSIVPELRSATIEKSWAGLRPGSFDTYPYIGQLPDLSNVFLAAGHFRAGIHLSAGTARVLSELITTGRASIDLTPFRPGRG